MLGTNQWSILMVAIGLFIPSSLGALKELNNVESDNRSSDHLRIQRRTTSAISLGNAATYTIFASTGIAIVPGDSTQVVTGDIGVGPIAITAITGFGSVSNGKGGSPLLVGKFYGPATTGPQDAALAVLTAYNAALALKASAAHSGLPSNYLDTLNTAKTPLTAGIYSWDGTLVIGANSVITLNGGCGDLFVFQAAGAISTGAGSRILLTGGLTAASVYWVTATVLTTGAGSTFAGMILAGTNVVIAGKLVGCVYSQTEVALHQATISLPSFVCAKPCVLVSNQDKSCDAGGYVNACFAGYLLQNGICTPCSSNHYALEGDTTCTICPVDTYNVKSALKSLSDCIVDK